VRKDEDKNLLERGFTLVELLIVVVILGILAGIVVFAVGGLTDSAEGNACATEADTFETAVQAYRADNSNNLPDGNGAAAGNGTTAEVAVVLESAELLNTVNPKFDGETPGWTFDSATGDVTAGAGCSAS